MGVPAEAEIIRQVRIDHSLQLCGCGKQIVAIHQ